MKSILTVMATCALGALVAFPASAAEGHRGRRGEQYGHHHEHARRHGHRPEVRYSGPELHRHVRYAPRVDGRYYQDSRHYHGVSREYYRYGYPRVAYGLPYGGGLNATLVVTFPLF